MTKLTTEQLAHYKRDGFLVLENFVNPCACDELRDHVENLVRNFDPAVISIFTTNEQTRHTDDYFMESANKISFFFEEEAFLPNGLLRQNKEQSINKIGHAMHDLDPVFEKFSRTSELATVTTDLGFQHPLIVQSMFIFKQPNIGGEVTCHQDSTFLCTNPPSVVGFWFALEDATRENGCLWVIPGGHKLGLKSRFVRDSEGKMRFEVLDQAPWPQDNLLPLEVSKGSMVILNGMLPHLSLANRSPKSRHAYTLHIIEGTCEYPAENWLQRAPDLPLRGF